MGRVWKKSGSGGYKYTQILKSRVQVCWALDKLGSGEKRNVWFGHLGYWKSRVRAGIEISGIGYLRVKTQFFL